MRKPEEVPLGPEYSGSRISREALLNDDDEVEEEESESDSEAEKDQNIHFADPADSDIELNVDEVFIEQTRERKYWTWLVA